MSENTFLTLTDQDIKDVRALPAGELLNYAQEVSEEIRVFKKDHEPPLNLEEQRILDEMNEWVLLFIQEDERRHKEETEPKLIKDMRKEELEAAYSEIYDERKYFLRSLRGKVWTECDREQYESMNRYAQAIVDEQEKN